MTDRHLTGWCGLKKADWWDRSPNEIAIHMVREGIAKQLNIDERHLRNRGSTLQQVSSGSVRRMMPGQLDGGGHYDDPQPQHAPSRLVDGILPLFGSLHGFTAWRESIQKRLVSQHCSLYVLVNAL